MSDTMIPIHIARALNMEATYQESFYREPGQISPVLTNDKAARGWREVLSRAQYHPGVSVADAMRNGISPAHLSAALNALKAEVAELKIPDFASGAALKAAKALQDIRTMAVAVSDDLLKVSYPGDQSIDPRGQISGGLVESLTVRPTDTAGVYSVWFRPEGNGSFYTDGQGIEVTLATEEGELLSDAKAILATEVETAARLYRLRALATLAAQDGDINSQVSIGEIDLSDNTATVHFNVGWPQQTYEADFSVNRLRVLYDPRAAGDFAASVAAYILKHHGGEIQAANSNTLESNTLE